MNVTELQVRHRQFGDGIIICQTASTVTVQFSEAFKEKRFLYPSVFESFLTFSNPTSQQEMESELREAHSQQELQRKKNQEEIDRRREEQLHAQANQKKAAARRLAASKRLAAAQGTTFKRKTVPERDEVEEQDIED